MTPTDWNPYHLAMVQRGSEKPVEILEAVITLAAAHGPEGVNFRDVAKLAGSTVSRVNKLYKTKSRLFSATLDWIIDRITTIEQEALDQANNVPEKLTAIFKAQERLLLEQTELLSAWYIFLTIGRTDQWVASRIQEQYVDRIETVRLILKELMDAGLMRPDLRPGLTAEDIVASVEGMGLVWLNRTDRQGVAAHGRRAARRWSKNLGLDLRQRI